MPRTAIQNLDSPAAVVALALLAAGCVGPLGGAPPTPADPTNPNERPAATTPYPNETVPFPDGPKSRPAVPEDLTAETAREFAIRHEFRYSYNELWEGPETGVGLSVHSCTVESTESRGPGYVVTVQCVGYVNRPDGDPESTATVHYDLPPWTVRYYVDGNSVLRTEVG